MFAIVPSDEATTQQGRDDNASKASFPEEGSDLDWLGAEDEGELGITQEPRCEGCISVGDYLPYGARLFYETNDNVMRLKDIGEKHRILVLGVIGSFTPYCWNRHLFRVINKSRYYEERGIDYICCISTNDAFCQAAWSTFLGCEDIVFMLADTTKRFTKQIGMDIVLPWLDNTVRSKRYVIYAEDMIVTKMIVSSNDGPNLKWQCEHLKPEVESVDEGGEESDDEAWI